MNINPKRVYREEKLKVDSQVISLLSKATYESFPKVLRELISNSYDADATLVEISINTKTEEISVFDNGNGMGQEQFSYFLTIAAQERRKRKSPKYGRERIGQFGVGFLAAFPFCREMTIETTITGSPIIINARIPATEYFKRERVVEEYYVQEIEEVTIPVEEITNEYRLNEHYTIVTLKGFTSLASQFFTSIQTEVRRNSINNYKPIERLKWDLQDNVILDYPKDSKIQDFLKQLPVGMDVFFNKKKLTRTVPIGEIITSGELDMKAMNVRYVIVSPWKPVVPIEMRGLKIHVNNVGIGQRETFGLAIQAGALPRISWLTGDVYIDEGGRDYLSVNRDGFTNAPIIEELYDRLRSKLRQAENIITQADIKLKQIETKLGMEIKGGGPRPTISVGNSKQFVEKKLQELRQSGFNVEYVDTKKIENEKETSRSDRYVRSDTIISKNKSPLEIDRIHKEIKVYEEHPAFEDIIDTQYGVFKIKYDEWEFRESDFPACEVKKDRIIKVNVKYPLFRDRKYGRIFLHISIPLALIANSGSIEKNIVKRIFLDWVQEYKKILK